MQSLNTLIGREALPRLTSKMNSARQVRSASFVPSGFDPSFVVVVVRDLDSLFIANPNGI
jgi:hypothetical protein